MITTAIRRQLLLPWALSAASCVMARAGGSSSHGICREASAVKR